MREYLILTPEASTNWLFNENVLFNLFFDKKIILMDRDDYQRYKRLSAISDIDFLKYYLLTLLNLRGMVRFLDYKNILTPRNVLKYMEFIDKRSKVIKKANQYDDKILSGYKNYINYISNKESFLSIIRNQADLINYRREKDIAEKHLKFIKDGKFDKAKKESYVRRLCTKLMAAQVVSDKIGGRIFDSLEYKSGIEILENEGVSIQYKFAKEVFNRNKHFMRMKQFMIDRGFIKEQSLISVPIVLLEGIRKYSSNIVSLLKSEIQRINFTELEREVISFLNERSSLKDDLSFSSFMSSIIGIRIDIFSYLSLLLSGVGFYQTRGFNPNYSLTSQLISNALAQEGEIKKRFYIRKMWIRWFFKLFKRNLREEDFLWGRTQRSMEDWTKMEVYVPYYEKALDI